MLDAGISVGVAGLKTITDGAKHLTDGAKGGLKKLRGGGPDADVDPRAQNANQTFKRMFKMMDYNRDHSLRDAELKAGLQVLEHAWGAFSELCKRLAASSVSSVAFHVLLLSRGSTSALSEEAPCAACSQIRATRRTS